MEVKGSMCLNLVSSAGCGSPQAFAFPLLKINPSFPMPQNLTLCFWLLYFGTYMNQIPWESRTYLYCLSHPASVAFQPKPLLPPASPSPGLPLQSVSCLPTWATGGCLPTNPISGIMCYYHKSGP